MAKSPSTSLVLGTLSGLGLALIYCFTLLDSIHSGLHTTMVFSITPANVISQNIPFIVLSGLGGLVTAWLAQKTKNKLLIGTIIIFGLILWAIAFQITIYGPYCSSLLGSMCDG